MIQMRVRDPDPDRPRPFKFDLVENQSRFFAGVHDGALGRRLVDHQVAVLGEHPVRDLDHFHVTMAPAEAESLPCSRSCARYFSTAIAAVVASPTAVVTWRVN